MREYVKGHEEIGLMNLSGVSAVNPGRLRFLLQLMDFVKWVSWTDCPANTAVRNLPPIPYHNHKLSTAYTTCEKNTKMNRLQAAGYFTAFNITK